MNKQPYLGASPFSARANESMREIPGTLIRVLRFDVSEFPSLRLSTCVWAIVLLGFVVRLVFLFLNANAGTDAWPRYQIAARWLLHPKHVPSEVWLPFHFWLLAGALRLWHSEWAARILTVVLGTLTLLPYWGTVRRLFARDVAVYSLLTFAVFGMHVGYSVTTSSEVPTIFLLVLGLYGWLRFISEDSRSWFLVSAISFDAACLCRYEPWVQVIFLAVMTLFTGVATKENVGARLRAAAQFLLLSELGAVGWATYSYFKWGSPFASAQHTVVLNAAAAKTSGHSLLYRASVMPGALLLSLGPIFFVSAAIGLIAIFRRRQSPQFALAGFLVLSAATQWYNAVVYRVEMARYTMMYSWLLIPFAFVGLKTVSGKRPKLAVAALAFFFAWQIGLVAGAEYAPCQIADKLGKVSASLPLPCNLRHLLSWLRANPQLPRGIVIDNYDFEGNDVVRFSALRGAFPYLVLPYGVAPQQAESELATFIRNNHPRTVIYCTDGPLGQMWRLGPAEDLEIPEFAMRLHRVWQDGQYRVYEIEDTLRSGLETRRERSDSNVRSRLSINVVVVLVGCRNTYMVKATGDPK